MKNKENINTDLKKEWNQNLELFVFFRDSIIDILLNETIYSKEDYLIIENIFSSIYRIIESNQPIENLCSKNIIYSILSFSNIILSLKEKIDECINSFQSLLSIYLEINYINLIYKKIIINLICEYLVSSKNYIINNILLNILSNSKNIEYIEQNKIKDLLLYSDILYNSRAINKSFESMYKKIIKIIIGNLIIYPPNEESIYNNIFLNKIKNIDFNIKFEVFKDIIIPSSNKNEIGIINIKKIQNEKIEIIINIVLEIFENITDDYHIEKSFKDFCVKIIEIFKEYKNENIDNSFFAIFFGDLSNIFFNKLLNLYSKDKTKLNELIKFIEDELVLFLINNHKNPFIFQFIEKCFNQEQFVKYGFSIIHKIFLEIQLFKNGIIIFNLVNLLFFFEDYFSTHLNHNLHEDEFYDILKILFLLLQNNYYIYIRIIFYNEKEIGRTISEIIFDIFLLVFQNYTKKENEYLILFHEVFKSSIKGHTIFYEMDNMKYNSLIYNDIKNKVFSLENNLCSDKYVIYTDFSFSIFFLAKYFSLKKLKKTLKHLELFFNSLFQNIIDLSKKNFFSQYENSKCNEYNIIYNFFNSKKNKIKEISFEKFEEIFNKENQNSRNIYFSMCIYLKASTRRSSAKTTNYNTINFSGKSNSYKIIGISESFNERKLNKLSLFSNNNIFENNHNENNDILNETNINNPSSRMYFDLRQNDKSKTIKEKNKKEKKIELNKELIKEKKYYFENIIQKGVIINPKNEFFFKTFSHSFIDIYFYNKSFINLKDFYLSNFNCEKDNKVLNYPSRLKNFSNQFESPLFLTQDLKFFDDECFKITHSYILPYLNKFQHKKIPFIKRNIEINQNAFQFECELICIKYSLFGMFLIGENYLLFRNYQIDSKKYFILSFETDRIDKEKTILLYFSEINEIKKRRFIFFDQALEFFLKNGKSYFFNFLSRHNYNKLILKLKEKKELLSKLLKNENKEKEEKLKYYISKYINNKISTYEFLLTLNYYSSRTYNDTSQYPIFPWVIKNFKELYKLNINEINKILLSKKSKNEFNNEESFSRIFKYPISAQTEIKRESAKYRFLDCSFDKFKSHFYSHYSTASFIFYYLMRMNPFMQNLIRLQNNSQENSNRMFVCIFDSQLAINLSNDNRELIPEFFNKIEFFINLNCANFGLNSKGIQTDDIIPIKLIYDNDNENNRNSLSLYVEFLILHRAILNSKFVNNSDDSIINWIDNVFGKNQYIENEDKALNLYNTFPSSTYKERCSFVNEIIKIEDNNIIITNNTKEKLFEQINITINFGMMPERLNLKGNLKREEIIEFEVHNKFFNNDNNINWIYIQLIDVENDLYLLVSENGYIELGEKKFVFIIKSELIKKVKLKDEDNNEFFDYHSTEIQYIIRYFNNKIISCRYRDNSFKIIFLDLNNKEKKIIKEKKVLCEDYVNAIREISNNSFIIGLKNGKIIEYEIKNDHYIEMKKYIFSHLSSIKIIEIDNSEFSLNIIITATNKEIFIRKLYDFELLTVINIEPNYKIKMLKLSPLKLIYVMCTGNDNKSYIFGFTLTGIKFAKSKGKFYNNFTFTKNGNLIVEYLNSRNIDVLNGSDLQYILEQKENLESGKILYFDNINSTIYMIYKSKKSDKNWIIYNSFNFDY